MATTTKNPLVRKLGPLPLYAWLLLALGAWFAYRRFASGGTSSNSDTSADTANGQDLATASDLPVAGGGASGAALHSALQDTSALDSSWGDSGWDDSSYDSSTSSNPLAPKASALTGQQYITYADSSQPFAYGSAPEQRPSSDPAFGRSFYEGSIDIPSQPASNRPTAQVVAPAPVTFQPAAQTVLVGVSGSRRLAV